MNIVKKIAFILLLIGGLNWGLVGLFGLDLVATLLGADSILSATVYTLVGVSALVIAFTSKSCGSCKTEEAPEPESTPEPEQPMGGQM